MRIIKFGSYLVLISVCFILAQPVLANSSDTATVTASVSAELISVSVDKSTIDYGAVPLGGSKLLSGILSVTNNGNVSEKIDVAGSDAESVPSGHSWTISSTATGKNIFSHVVTHSGTDVYLDTSYKQLLASITAGSGLPSGISTKIEMPTTESDAGNYTTSITFRAAKAS